MSTFGFSERDAKRIGHAVRRVERGPEQVRLGGPNAHNASPGVRIMLGTHTSAAWSKNSTKVITIYGGEPSENGIPPNSAYTVSANNIFASITANSAVTSRWVAVSCNGWGWYLIAAEC